MMAHHSPRIFLLQALAQSASRACSLNGHAETYSCLRINKDTLVPAMTFALNLKRKAKMRGNLWLTNLQTHRSPSLYSLYKCQAGNPTGLWP